MQEWVEPESINRSNRKPVMPVSSLTSTKHFHQLSGARCRSINLYKGELRLVSYGSPSPGTMDVMELHVVQHMHLHISIIQNAFQKSYNRTWKCVFFGKSWTKQHVNISCSVNYIPAAFSQKPVIIEMCVEIHSGYNEAGKLLVYTECTMYLMLCGSRSYWKAFCIQIGVKLMLGTGV